MAKAAGPSSGRRGHETLSCRSLQKIKLFKLITVTKSFLRFATFRSKRCTFAWQSGGNCAFCPILAIVINQNIEKNIKLSWLEVYKNKNEKVTNLIFPKTSKSMKVLLLATHIILSAVLWWFNKYVYARNFFFATIVSPFTVSHLLSQGFIPFFGHQFLIHPSMTVCGSSHRLIGAPAKLIQTHLTLMRGPDANQVNQVCGNWKKKQKKTFQYKQTLLPFFLFFWFLFQLNCYKCCFLTGTSYTAQSHGWVTSLHKK